MPIFDLNKNMKNNLFYIIFFITCIQIYSCSNNKSRNISARTRQENTNKGNCNDAQEFARKNYIRNVDDEIYLTIVGCEENPDGSYKITFTNTGTSDNPGMPIKQLVRVCFDGNNYYCNFN